jgi:hypothetical protein
VAEGRTPSDAERDEGKRIEEHPIVREIADELAEEARSSIAPEPKPHRKKSSS